MSQTETILLFVLGFCAALLIVLLFGRGFFGLMGRWSGWRQERQLPAAMRDLEAERDSLRAEKAIMAQRLETATGDIKMRMAEQMAEVARNRNRVLDLSANLEQANARIAVLQQDLAERLEQIAALKAQIEENVRAINEAWQKASENEKAAAAAVKLQASLTRDVAERETRIANLENEAKAMREIVSMFVPGPDEVRQAKAARAIGQQGGFQEAMMPNLQQHAAPIIQPLEAASIEDLRVPQAGNDEQISTMGESQDAVDRSANNVLSLAERVRGLQVGMKRR